MNRDLLLALLSLDAYNRGPAGSRPGMIGLSDQVGTAYVSSLRSWNEPTGFFAQSYDTPYGTVISYRGTDDPTGSFSGNDITNGWLISAGFLGFPFGSQVADAAAFYDAVKNTLGGQLPILTGHSLGGGLAGLMSSLTGAPAAVFDNSPFSIPSALAHIAALAQGVTLPVAFSQINAYFVVGEALQFVRQLGIPIELALLTAVNPAVGAALAGYHIGSEIAINYHPVSANGGYQNVVNLHSQALMTVMLWADQQESAGALDASWKSIGNPFVTALFNADLAKAVGYDPANRNGSKSEGEKMLAAIAYSVIDEGTTVFGNTAIHAMFNDAEQLGTDVSAKVLPASLTSDDAKKALAEIVVQFAGDAALQKSVAPADLKGVLGQVPNDNLLQIDLDPTRWVKTAQSSGDIVGLNDLDAALVSYLKTLATGKTVAALDKSLADWGDSYKSVTLASFDIGSSAGSYKADALPQAKSGDAGGLLFMGNTSAVQVTGGDGKDLIIGGSGNDTLRGGAGTDVLIGGAGNDTLIADGVDTATARGDDLVGGAGADTFVIDYGPGMGGGVLPVFHILDGMAEDSLYFSSNLIDGIYPDGSSETIDPLLGGGNYVEGPLSLYPPDTFDSNGNGIIDYHHIFTRYEQFSGNGTLSKAVMADYEMSGSDLVIDLWSWSYNDATGQQETKEVAQVVVSDFVQGDLGITLYDPLRIDGTGGQSAYDQQIAAIDGTRTTLAGAQGAKSLKWADQNPDPSGSPDPTIPPIVVDPGTPPVTTTPGDDVVEAPGGDTQIGTGDGNDFVELGAGGNVVDMGTGDDVVSYETMSESVDVTLTDAGPGTSSLGDLLYGVEDIVGTAFGDTLVGNGLDNRIWGRGGDDSILGGAGNDYLYGEDGNDTLVGGAGNDVLDGGTGNDTAVFSGNRSDYAITRLDGGGLQIVDLRAGSPDGTDVVRNIETLMFADGSVSEFAAANHVPDSGGALGIVTSQGATANFSISDLLAGSSDVDGDTLSVSHVGQAVGGDITRSADGGVVFTPTPGFSGLAQFTIGIDDGHGGTTTRDVIIYVAAPTANTPPTVSGPVMGSATEDGAVVSLDALANASDVDSGTALQVVGVPASLPAGVAYDAATHSFALDPSNAAYQDLAAGATQTVTIAYGVSDGIVTTPATASFTVTGTNDAPVVTGAVSGSATEDGAAVSLDALANASDVDSGTVLQVVGVPASLPAGVAYDAATHSFALDPSNAAYQHLAAGATQTVTIAYGVGDGIVTTPATASFTVTGTNDTARIGGTTTGDVTEDGQLSATGLLTITDVDDGQAAFRAGTFTGSHGSLVLLADGHWTYTLANADAAVQALATGQSMVDAIDVFSVDGTRQTLSITIHGVDEPTAGIVGTDWSDLLLGTSSGSLIDARGGNDLVVAFGGNDTLIGGAGNDVIIGGGGNDIFIATPNDGNDIYVGGSGRDTLDLSRITTAVSVDLSVGRASGSQIGNDLLVLIDNVIGGAGNDLIKGNGSVNDLSGMGGNDTIQGGGGADLITGGAGNDLLTGGGGADTFAFGAGFGRDTVADFLAGTSSHDILQFDHAVFASASAVLQASSQVGQDVLITATSLDSVLLKNVSLLSLTASDVRII